MTINENLLSELAAREEIRQLVLLYSRGVDRKDLALLQTLYAKDATDDHGKYFSGGAGDYLEFLERSFPHMRMSGHHICNHLISVDGNTGEGEVYALAVHLFPDGKGGFVEDIKYVRYVDRYRKEEGRWLFASRVVTFDYESQRPVPAPEGAPTDPAADPSYTTLSARLFRRGPRP